MAIGADDFLEFVLEQMIELDAVAARPMFGGHGLYLGPTFFGIVHDSRLYLKTDESTSEEYISRGMGQFSPNERQTLKTYYEVPADVLEDRNALALWAREAVESAQGASLR